MEPPAVRETFVIETPTPSLMTNERGNAYRTLHPPCPADVNYFMHKALFYKPRDRGWSGGLPITGMFPVCAILHRLID